VHAVIDSQTEESINPSFLMLRGDQEFSRCSRKKAKKHRRQRKIKDEENKVYGFVINSV
jgi:hypothetical protein